MLGNILIFYVCLAKTEERRNSKFSPKARAVLPWVPELIFFLSYCLWNQERAVPVKRTIQHRYLNSRL